MENRESLKRVLYTMLLVNGFILMYYLAVTSASKKIICDMNGAYTFLSVAEGIPADTVTLCLKTFALFGALSVLILLKEDVCKESKMYLHLASLGEMLLSFELICALNFYYSGVALVVLADLLYYEEKKAPRVAYIVIQILEFVFGSDKILGYFYNNIQFSSYLYCFHPVVRSWIVAVESSMTFINIFMFVIFVLLMIIRQKNENSRIRLLNASLSGKNVQLQEANIKLREYGETIKRMTEITERNRLAREIHDTLGHTLTGIVVSADAGRILMDTDPREAKIRFEVIGTTARQGLEDVRRSIHALRPDALESHDIESALEKMVENVRETTGTEISYEQMAGELILAQDEEDTLYRIVQEGLTNAVRHGHATEISVIIFREDHSLKVSIRDNGIGSQKVEPGFGLDYMRERIEVLKGSLSYGNREDGYQGFYLEAEIPIRSRNPEDE